MPTWQSVKKAWKKAISAWFQAKGFPVAFKETFVAVYETLLWVFIAACRKFWQMKWQGKLIVIFILLCLSLCTKP
jgi:hypothetical protein